MTSLPAWACRNLESVKALLMAIETEASDAEDDNISRKTRHHLSEIRASAKAALIFGNEITSRNDDILTENGHEQEAAQTTR